MPPETDTSAELDETIRRQNSTREFVKTVYFDYDKAELRDDQVPVLRANAAWLKNNPGFRVIVEGHCDERGTIEYNLALGEKRAQKVLSYLVDLGVPAALLRANTYGKERPADAGHDEDAWAKNRRGEFSLEK